MPSFKEVISYQSADGSWSAASLEVLTKFFCWKDCETSLSKTCLATVLALYVLQEDFPDREPEWQLIAQKAKRYLNGQAVDIQHELNKIDELILATL